MFYIRFSFEILLYFLTFASKPSDVHIPVNLKRIAHRAKLSATGWKQMAIFYLFQGKYHSFNNSCRVAISYSVCINCFVYYLCANLEANIYYIYTTLSTLCIKKFKSCVTNPNINNYRFKKINNFYVFGPPNTNVSLGTA